MNANTLNSLNTLSLEKINQNKKILNINYKISPPNNNIEYNKDLTKKVGIFQPTMRYKARTDLERIYDVLNGYKFDEKSKEIIERQLKSINLYDCKKKNNSLDKRTETKKIIIIKI